MSSASSSRPKVNLRSTAVKRIMQEAAELADAEEDDFTAAPLETDIFEWHCTMRGVPNSEYDGGLYHLRILLPPSYPMSAPDIMLLTPNGRFELGKKICIDGLTSFHAGSWQPAWGVRTAILGLRSFWMQGGEALSAIGALDYSKEERRRLAGLSRGWTCPACAQSNHSLLPDKPSLLAGSRAVDSVNANTESPLSDVAGQPETTIDPSSPPVLSDPTSNPDSTQPVPAASPAPAASSSRPPQSIRTFSMDQQQPDTLTPVAMDQSQSSFSSLDALTAETTTLARAEAANTVSPPPPLDPPTQITSPSTSIPSTLDVAGRPASIGDAPPIVSTALDPRRRRVAPMWLDALIFACLSMLLFLIVRKIAAPRTEPYVMREL